MQGLKVLVLVLSSIAVAATAAVGQTKVTTGPSRFTRNSYRTPNLDERVNRFAKALDLDASQQSGLKSALQRQQARINQLRLDPSLSGDERMSRLRDLQEDTVVQIRRLLNDEQKKKYDPQNHASEIKSSDSYVNDFLKAPQH